MTQQKATLDSLPALSRLVSCRRIAPKFQHSLFAVLLYKYLSR